MNVSSFLQNDKVYTEELDLLSFHEVSEPAV